MKRIALFLLAAAMSAHAQSTPSLPDCRQPNLTPGQECAYAHTSLPTQVYLGDITLSSGDRVHMTGPVPPFGVSAIAPAVTGTRSFELGALFSVQTETLGYQRFVTDGIKITAVKEWSDLVGLDIRGAILRYSLGVGALPGQNHTYSLAAGPRVQHPFGRVTPYGEALVGGLHQYYPGLSLSGVAGVKVRLSQRFSLVPADLEYRYALLQNSTVTANPRRGRIEVQAGLLYRFSRLM